MLWVGHDPRRQSGVSTFSPANVGFKSWAPFLVLGLCGNEATFLCTDRASHSAAVGVPARCQELPVGRAQSGGTNGGRPGAGLCCLRYDTCPVLCSEEQVCPPCLVMTLAYLLVLQRKLFSFLLSFPHPENVHPQSLWLSPGTRFWFLCRGLAKVSCPSTEESPSG